MIRERQPRHSNVILSTVYKITIRNVQNRASEKRWMLLKYGTHSSIGQFYGHIPAPSLTLAPLRYMMDIIPQPVLID